MKTNKSVKKTRSFTVYVDDTVEGRQVGLQWPINNYGEIDVDGIPYGEELFPYDGRYTVTVTSKVDGFGIDIEPNGPGACHPASYTDNGNSICKELCSLLGYKATKPETIYIKTELVAGK